MPKNIRNNKKHNKKGSTSDGLRPGRYPMNGTLVVPNTVLGMPRRIRTNVRTALQGYLPGGAAATGSCEIYSNSVLAPFNTGSTVVGMGLTLTDSSTLAGNPVSTAFYASGYQYYRVYSARLMVSAVTAAGGDTVNIWLYPIPQNFSAPTQRLQLAAGQAGFKRMTVTSGMRPSKIVSSVRPAQVLGLTEEEYRSSTLSSSLFTSNPAAQMLTDWVVSYATIDGAITTSQIYFEFELELEYECFDIVQQTA